jgi:hypothetical protein
MRRRGSRKADNSWARHGSNGEQASRREGGDKGGKPIGDTPYPKAELQRQLAATEERRGADGDGGAAAKAVARARVAKQEAATAGFANPRARGGGFIGPPREPRHAGLGQRAGGCRAVPWPDSSSSLSLAQGQG